MQKSKTFRPWQPEQTTFLPPSPREWLSEDHQVYFLLDLVDELDLSPDPRSGQRSPWEEGIRSTDVDEVFRAAVDDAAALRVQRGHHLIPEDREGLLRGPCRCGESLPQRTGAYPRP